MQTTCSHVPGDSQRRPLRLERDSQYFSTDYLAHNLKARSVRGGAVTFAAQGVKFLLQTGSTAVLARLLLPSDFGLVAMVTAVTGFVAMFKDAGLSMATIQRADITHDQVSTLFWINVALSAAVMLILAAMAPILAAFYAEPRLVWITLALAGTMLFGGFTVQHQALLRRQMRFKALAVIEITALIAGIAVAVAMALMHFGYWSLVGSAAATSLTNMISVWAFCNWRPGPPRRRSGTGPLLRFGGHLTAANFMNYFARNLDNILIGWAWGANALGTYSKAYSLMMLPLTQLTAPAASVAIPVLSRIVPTPDRYRRYYYRCVTLIAFASMPLMGYLFAVSTPLIDVLLGPGWEASASVFRWLLVGALFHPVASTNGWVHISMGRPDRMLRWMLLGVPPIICSFFIGLPYGPVGVARAYSVCLLSVNLVPCLAFAFHGSPLTLTDFFRAILKPFLLSCAVGLIAYLTLLACSDLASLLQLVVTATAALAFGLISLLTPPFRADVATSLDLLSHMRRDRAASEVSSI